MKFLITALLLSLTIGAQAANVIDAKVQAAQAAESRPQGDRDRDRNRMAQYTLNFFGMRDDMRVMELMPGGGWYTRILGPVLAENGQLYVAIGTGRVAENIVGTPGFENVEVVETDANLHRPAGERLYVLEDFAFCFTAHDIVLTFLNLHNVVSCTLALLHQR